MKRTISSYVDLQNLATCVEFLNKQGLVVRSKSDAVNSCIEMLASILERNGEPAGSIKLLDAALGLTIKELSTQIALPADLQTSPELDAELLERVKGKIEGLNPGDPSLVDNGLTEEEDERNL